MKVKKSIKKGLILTISVAAGLVVLIAFSIAALLVNSSMQTVKQNNINLLINDSAATINNKIDAMFATAYTIASDEMVCDPSLTFEDKHEKLNKYASDRSINSIGYITPDGHLISTDGFENDIANRQYFTDLMNGGRYISNPSFNTATQSQIIFIGVPLYNNGSVIGAITLTFDSSYLSEVIDVIKFNNHGQAYMLSSTGTVVASYNMDDVLNKKNLQKLSEEDPTLAEDAAFEMEMITNGSGSATYNKNMYYYTHLDQGDGWTLIYEIAQSDYNKDMSQVWILFMVCEFSVIIIIIIISFLIGSNIGKRLEKLQGYIDEIAEGNFLITFEQADLDKGDEIGRIYQSLDKTVNDVGNAIASIKKYSDELAQNGATLEATSNTLNQGTDTVVRSMNEIQSGNAENAKEIENINNEMTKFNANVELVNTNIEDVVKITDNATSKLSSGNKEVEKLKASFDKFNEFFDTFATEIKNMNDNLSSVSMITNTISDIASETNLLSLNASIEAARAGEAGRGFAVVAQEIAKLAQQCSLSVNEISNVVNTITTSSSSLIETSTIMGDQIKSQDEIIESTITSFEFLTQEMNDMIPAIDNISKVSKENLEMARNIGDSISTANAISEELVATTSEVNEATKGFSASSNNVNIASGEINELTKELNDISAKFKC